MNDDNMKFIWRWGRPGKRIAFRWPWKDTGWYITHPWRFICDVLECLWLETKWFIQRGLYGYSESDISDLHSYLLWWLPYAIRDLRDRTISYPGTLTPGKWYDILTEIADGLETTEYLYEEKGEVSNKALQLLVKWFFHLWD